MKKILLVVIPIVLTVLIWYKSPYKVVREYSASSLNGSTVYVSIQFKAYRNFFSPTTYEGTIIVDDDTYSTPNNQGDDRFFVKLRDKISGKSRFPVLVREDENGSFVAADLLYILSACSKFDYVYFSLTNNDEEGFMGPASNAAEAESLYQRINDK